MSLPLRSCKVDFQDRWSKISSTIENVLNGGSKKKVTQKEWNERFMDIFYVCVISEEPLAEKLYLQTKNFIIQHVSSIKNTLIQSKNVISDYNFNWNLYYNSSVSINNLFNFLNKNFVNRMKPFELSYSPINLISSTSSNCNDFSNDDILEILDLFMLIWKNHLIVPLIQTIQNSFLNELKIFYDLTNPLLEENILNGFIKSLVIIDNYFENIWKEFFIVDDFSNKIENEIVSLNRILSVDLKQKNDFLVYCTKSFETILNQLKFINSIFFRWPTFQQRLEKSLKDCFVSEMFEMFSLNIPLIFDNSSSLESIIQHKNLSVIFKLCQLNDRVLTLFEKGLISYFTSRGLIMSQSSINLLSYKEVNDATVRIMDFIHTSTGLIDFICENDSTYATKIKDLVFENVLNYKVKLIDNSSDVFTIKLLCKYIDGLLLKKIPISLDLDIYIDKVVQLIKYINDKDVFIKVYSNILAKRLINNSNVLTSEASFISKLKNVCSNDCINKLNRMYNDIRISKDMNDQFISSIKMLKNTNTSNLFHSNDSFYYDRFYFLILQSSAWPYSPTSETKINIPSIIHTNYKIFENFFKNEYEARQLVWMYHLAFGDLIFHIKSSDQKNVERVHINVNMIQFAILDVFNDVFISTKKNLLEILTMESADFELNVYPLVECKLLIEFVNESNEECYSLNMSYQRKSIKVCKIRKAVEEKKYEQDISATESINDRRLAIQATIVRMMKQVGVCKHNDLIYQVIHQNKILFKPSINIIKENIELLIEKQYMFRSKNNPEEYIYQQ